MLGERPPGGWAGAAAESAGNAGGSGEDTGSPPANCGNAARGPGVSALADAPGDCWPHCILSGGLRFHEERGKA
jgi:hypothetical protein